jgi:hypothetical protein
LTASAGHGRAEHLCEWAERLCSFASAGYDCAERLYEFLEVLYPFHTTSCEGEDGIHEESHGHRALLPVLFPVLTTPAERLGVPSMRFETPNQERKMPTVKPRPVFRGIRARDRPREHDDVRDAVGHL